MLTGENRVKRVSVSKKRNNFNVQQTLKSRVQYKKTNVYQRLSEEIYN